MRLTLLVSLAAATLVAAIPARAGEITINIDKSEQRMTVALDQVPLYNWPVSTGRSGHDTPSGSYKAFRMEEDHYSKEWDDAPMPHSVFFTMEGHAIHGTFDEKRLGTPASHGCVRLSRANAATLYSLVRKEGLRNTKVSLYGVTPASAPAVASAPAKKKPRQQQDGYEEYAYTGSVNGPGYAPPGYRYRETYVEPRYYREPAPRGSYYYGDAPARAYRGPRDMW